MTPTDSTTQFKFFDGLPTEITLQILSMAPCQALLLLEKKITEVAIEVFTKINKELLIFYPVITNFYTRKSFSYARKPLLLFKLMVKIINQNAIWLGCHLDKSKPKKYLQVDWDLKNVNVYVKQIYNKTIVVENRDLTTIADAISRAISVPLVNTDKKDPNFGRNAFNFLLSKPEIRTITSLNMSSSKLHFIPVEIEALPNLCHLNFDENQILSLPRLKTLESRLSTLSITLNKIQKIDLSPFVNLRHLCLSNNRFNSIPETVFQLTTLDYLSIDASCFNRIPEAIKNLSKLRTLIINNNSLYSLQNLKFLTNLTFLKARSNNITQISDIMHLTNLNYLDLEENKIHEIPENFWKLSNLTYLDLSENRLQKISQNLGNLTRLLNLHLHTNRISKLPESIGHLTQLTSLCVYENDLSKFPNVFSGLSNLTLLNLRSNHLTQLPFMGSYLQRLSILNVAFNSLKYLPSLVKLTTLTNLTLRGNPLEQIPILPNYLYQVTVDVPQKNKFPELEKFPFRIVR